MPCSVKLCKYMNFTILSNADQHLEGGWWFDLLVKSKICVSCTRLLFLAQQWIKVVIMLGPSRPTNASNVMKKSRHRWRIPILLLNQYRAGRWLTCLLYWHSYCLVLLNRTLCRQTTLYNETDHRILVTVQVPLPYWYLHHLEWLYTTLDQIAQTGALATLVRLLFALDVQSQYKNKTM